MLLVSSLIGTGFAQEAPPIVNGSTTQDFESVGAITMVHQNEYYSFCSGTLIHPEYVLTAAHCVDAAYDYSRQGIKIKFTLGHNMANDSGIYESVGVEEYLEHPDYSENSNLHDIGILKLKKPMTEAVPMPLNETNLNQAWAGLELHYVGFGITDDNLENGGKKRTTQIPIVSWDSRVVYAYDATTNLCSGDSGGAAVRIKSNGDQTLVGVNSFVFPYEGSDPCDGGGSGATRVDSHMNWIEDEVPMDEVDYSEPGPDPEPDPEEEFVDGGLPERPMEPENVGACVSGPKNSPPPAWMLLLSGILLNRRRKR